MWKFLPGLKACLFAVVVTGCVNIPPESIVVNGKISDGITVMEDNTNLVIQGWRDTAIALLEAEFDDIYDRSEAKYRSGSNIPSGQALTPDQDRDVAVFVMLVNQAVRDKIDGKVAEMKKVSQANAAALRGANDSITQLLQSAQSVISGRNALIKDVAQLSPVAADVVDFVKDAKQAALDAL